MMKWKEILFYLIFFFISSSSHIFSGFYNANITEDYSAAILISKDRLIASKKIIEVARYPEGILFNIIRKTKSFCFDCNRIFLRDYFDFFVEHLSSMSNAIGKQSSKRQQTLFKILNKRLENTIQILQLQSKKVIRNKVIGIIPFCDEIANPDENLSPSLVLLHQKIRQNFFIATFYSIYRYFPNIAVYVPSVSGIKFLQKWKIPARYVINLEKNLSLVPREKFFFFDNVNRTKPRPRNQLLPKYALLSAIQSLESDSLWSTYRYLYYTEGDQILHLRNLQSILKGIDMRQGKDLIIPHRMQVRKKELRSF